MSGIFDAFLEGLMSTTSKVELEVMLPAGHDPLELYQIFKIALDNAGCSLTGFEVKKDNA